MDNVLNSGRNFDYSNCLAVSDNGDDDDGRGEDDENNRGDDVINVEDCLANTDFSTLASNATEICGLTINRYMLITNSGSFGVRLTYPAASELNYNPKLRISYLANSTNGGADSGLGFNNNPSKVEFREEYGSNTGISGSNITKQQTVSHPQVSCKISTSVSECNISLPDAVRILRESSGYKMNSFQIDAENNMNTIKPSHDNKYYYVYARRNLVTGAIETLY